MTQLNSLKHNLEKERLKWITEKYERMTVMFYIYVCKITFVPFGILLTSPCNFWFFSCRQILECADYSKFSRKRPIICNHWCKSHTSG